MMVERVPIRGAGGGESRERHCNETRLGWGVKTEAPAGRAEIAFDVSDLDGVLLWSRPRRRADG